MYCPRQSSDDNCVGIYDEGVRLLIITFHRVAVWGICHESGFETIVLGLSLKLVLVLRISSS